MAKASTHTMLQLLVLHLALLAAGGSAASAAGASHAAAAQQLAHHHRYGGGPGSQVHDVAVELPEQPPRQTSAETWRRIQEAHAAGTLGAGAPAHEVRCWRPGSARIPISPARNGGDVCITYVSRGPASCDTGGSVG